MPAVGGRTPFRRLDALARSPWGLALVATWSFAEAILLPIVPDVALGLLVLVAPRRVVRLFLAAVAGSLLGAAVLWCLVRADPDAVRSALLALPGIGQDMIATVTHEVAGGNPLALASLGFGAPLKVDVYAWALGPVAPGPLALGVILNRLARVAPFVLVCAAIGLAAPGWLRRHDRTVLAGYAGFWLAIYAAYWR